MTRSRFGLVRNTAAGPLLDLLLVGSVGAVLVTRAYLAATGYPQVGGGTLHIAHVLWGGLLMLVAIVVALTTIDTGARRVVAVAGGIGFGLFIDEIGKFITKNVDYFFQPAIAIIYVCFIAMFFAFRFITRDDNLTPQLALANALALLSETPCRTLSESEKERLEELIGRAEGLPLTAVVAPAVHGLATREQRPSRVDAFVRRYVRTPYERFAASRLFLWVIGIEAFLGVVTVLGLAVNVVLLIPGATRSAAQRNLEAGAGTSAAAIGTLLGGTVYALMMTVGFFQLRRSRLSALVWFDRAYVFSILVVQVFLFAESQLAALSGFAVTLVMWGAVRIALTDERARTGTERAAVSLTPSDGRR